MPTTQTANPPTFESVWAGFQETDRMMKEHTREMEKFWEGMKELRESQERNRPYRQRNL